jgi:hypothetical protein
LHYRLGWVASPGALPRERFSSVAHLGHQVAKPSGCYAAGARSENL